MKKSIVKNIIFKFSLEIFRIIIPIISVPYIYRIFKPEVMGQIEFSQSIVGYFFIFAGFGVYTYGLREISRVRNNKEQRDKLFTDLFIISTVSSVVVTLLYFGYVYFKFNSDLILKNMLLINSINLISYIFYIEWINEAFENYKFISQKTIIIKIINLICILLFIKFSEDFYKYLFLINIFIFFNNFASFIYIRRYISFSFKNIEVKKYLFPLFLMILISNINVLYTQLDKIALGFYGKKIEEVAYYGVAQKVMSIMMLIIMSIVRVMMPRLSFYLGEGNKVEYENLLNKTFPYIYLLVFPISIGTVILSNEIALFFGGIEYLVAKFAIIVFGIRLIIVTIESILANQVIFLNQKEKVILYLYGLGGIINFLLKLYLIKYNILTSGTAILTTMISEIVLIILEYKYIKKYLNYDLKVFKLGNLKYLIFSLLFFIIKYLLRDLNYNNLINSLIVFICCSSVYFIILFITKDKCLNEILEKLNIKQFLKGKI
ncbi:oligosaccharide flippase family protein [Fusobacterium mortiferum]|uniref:oligosaccharide flippase family protein n=1 Tax=Fusobacterium mortiferum TaxID=850 RepID=UPI0022E299E1|nr:oligosaccharide flippase family protein [Fusobacterium mortiferum]